MYNINFPDLHTYGLMVVYMFHAVCVREPEYPTIILGMKTLYNNICDTAQLHVAS